MGVFSLFKGNKVGKLAEVPTLGGGPLKQRIDVLRLELENGTPGVGLKVVTKSLISYQAVPVSLNKEQAIELASQILQAVDDGQI